MTQRVTVVGLKEFQKALRTMDRDLPKQLRVGLNEIAVFVVGKAQPKVARRSGRAAGSMRAASSQREARIRAGGGKAPYYPWLDFGGGVGPNKSVRRPFIREGRYIYPTVDEHRTDIETIAARVLTVVATGAGLEIS